MFEKIITDKKEIEGLPATALGLAAQTAVSKGHVHATAESGPWVITLDAPSYLPVLQHAKNRSLREEVYLAYVTRASSGDLDNTSIIDQILNLRLHKAKLLGYNNYAEVSLAMKMATVSKAEELLEKLRIASRDAAVQDMEDLKNFATEQGASEANNLSHWDITFWSERLCESKYDINEWAEVLSADAFSAFEDAGLENNQAIRETGHRFRDTILALGGGKPPLEVFVEFRGREPSPEALLRHNGLFQVPAST